ncbi:MAG: DUF4139 domain-containing protein [Kofleriaceae bacterium]
MKLEAPIRRVTVFERGARVTRVAKLRWGGAATDVIAASLPLGLLDDSVRVAARGPQADAVAVAVAVILDAPGEDPSLPDEISEAAREAALADELAQGEAALLRDELAALAGAPLILEPAEDAAPAPWSAIVAARRELASLRLTRTRALREALIAAEQRAEETARALELARQADRARSSARSPRTAEVRKALRMSLVPTGPSVTEGDLELTIEYAVRGARWAPSYVARYAGGELRWTMRAMVAQETGEDWRGVTVRLSTAELDRWEPLPELAALKIGKAQPSKRRPPRPAPAGVDELFADFDRDRQRRARRAPPEPPPAKPSPVKLEREVPWAEIAAELEVGAGLTEEPEQPEELGSPLADLAALSESSIERKPASKKKAGAPARMRSSAPPPPSGPMAPASFAPMPAAGGPPGAALSARRLVPPPPPEPKVERDLGGLVMASVDHARRGHLVPMSLAQRYEIPAEYDDKVIHAHLRHVDDRARAVERAALPKGCAAEWSHAFDFAFEAQGLVELASDGGWHSIPLESRAASAKLLHVAVPSEASEVFRLATSTNPFDAPILPGPTDVYDGDHFLATTAAPTASPGGELHLALGVDPAIKIARNAQFREEVTGVLRGGLRLIHEVRLDVQSHAAAAIELEVRERVPVPRDRDSEDIAVEVVDVKPAWTPYTPPLAGPERAPLRGGYCWRLSLAPRAEAHLSATYEVRIASKHELVNGNRREP